jgi:uncharacterized protein YjiS (DUF1127 family)
MPVEDVTMTSIHHDLDLISRVDGWSALTWHDGSLASEGFHEAKLRKVHAAGGLQLKRFADLALGWHERARQRRALLRLDDRLLHDIGVGRSMAEAEARKPFWRP